MSRPRPGRFPLDLPVLTLALSLILLALMLGGCTLLRRPAADPLAVYRPALGPRFTVDPGRLAAMPQYSLTVKVDPVALAYTGTAEITFPVTGSLPLTELYFRLYPNLPQFNGQLQLTDVMVNNAAVNYAFAAGGSAAHLAWTKPLAVGQVAHVHLGFTGQPSQRADGAYTLVGKSKGILSLGTFYPILAPRRADAWALDVADSQGDAGYAEAALYQVAVTTPADQVIVASGTETGKTQAADGWVTTRYVQGPAREFALLLSPQYQVLEEETYGTRVRSYYLAEDADNAKTALYTALAALQIYTDEFGPYPYRDMAVVEAPLTFRGQEFPGLSLIGDQTYNKYQGDLEKLVAHEVAHQWWYNQVGSDQTQSPWLDEGLAEFSMYVYFAARHGVPDADLLRLRRWEAPVALARQSGIDAPIGRPVASYNQNNYETIVYAKGALFFANLRETVGPAAFRDFLRTYLDTYRWQIATPDDMRTVIQKVSGRDLGPMFARWVDGTS